MKVDDLNNHLEDIVKYLKKELAKLRTGRATSNIVDDIKVDAYEGTDPLNLNEVATISINDPQSIVVTPWDKGVVKKIEEAITDSDRGLNPINNGDNIIIQIPQLTEERRGEIVKQVKSLVEESKIKVRNVRQDAIKSVEEREKQGVISEDDMFREKKIIEDSVSKTNIDLDNVGKQKQEELMKL